MSKAFVACADVRRRWSVNTSACLQPFTREANVSRETRCLWRSRWYCRVRSCEVSRCAIEQLTKKRSVSAFSFQRAFPFVKSTARRIFWHSSVPRASSVSEIVRGKQSTSPKTKDKLRISLQFENYLSMVNVKFYGFINDVIMIIINVNVVRFYRTNHRRWNKMVYGSQGSE